MKPNKSLFNIFLDYSLVKRRGPGEVAATDLLVDLLTPIAGQQNILIEEFPNTIPLALDSKLIVDGMPVNSRPISFASGMFDETIEMIEFHGESDYHKGYIAYNKHSQVISLHTFFTQPSVAISNQDVSTLSAAKTIKGFVEIEKYEYISRNILVGNVVNPKRILFSHIDTVESGFIDNLTGVAAMYDMLVANPNLFDTNLFVFSGNEELSYDGAIYWGKGYREFERRHAGLLDNAMQIYVIDCIGQTKHVVHREKSVIDLAFPLSNIDKYYDKTYLFAGDMHRLMTIYHSDLDGPGAFDKKYYDVVVKYIMDSMD